MRNRTALITGGMGGIGTAISRHLADEGAQVIVGYQRDHKSAEKWLNEQKSQGYRFVINYVDVTDFESCKNAVNDIETKFGGIDILVNNAGIIRDIPLYKMDLDLWHSVIQTNLNSIFNITRQAINGMIERGYGRIVNMASSSAHKGEIGQVNYGASKAGVHGFTKSLSHEVAKKGITVNTVSPGHVKTNMLKSMSGKALQAMIEQIPVGRLGQPNEIARAVGFLASEQSGFVTGTNLMINGGQY